MAAEFILLLQDRMTPQLGAAAKFADSALMRLRNDMNATSRTSGQMGGSIDGIRTKIEALRKVANSTTDWRILKDGMREADRLEEKLTRIQGKVKGGGMFGSMLKANIASGIMFKAMDMAIDIPKEALSLAMERQRQQVNFQVMTGNRTTGNNLLSDITKMADATPFEGKDLIENTKLLMQMGVTVKDVMPVLHQLGDISGADAVKLQSLSMAFGKVASEGRLDGMALKEMIIAGFNPLNEISKRTGTNMATLRKEMEKGAIGYDMVRAAMDAATGAGGRFHNLLAIQAETTFGRQTTLLDHYHHALADFGDSLMPIANNLMDAATRTLNWMNLTESAPEKLQRERTEVNSLVHSITDYNASNNYRKSLLIQLEGKYPDLFNNLDIEHTKNSDLLATLNSVNRAYDSRIRLAGTAFAADVAKDDQKDLYSLKQNIEQTIAYYKAHPNEQNKFRWFGTTERYLTAAQANTIAWTKKDYSRWGGVTRYDSENIQGLQDFLNQVVNPNLPKVDNRVLQTEATNNFNQAYADIAKAFDLRLHPNLLKSTFKDKNSLGSFMALANQIQPNGAGKNYFKLAGDSNYMQALRTAMNPASGGSVAGTGDMGDSIDTLRSGAERAMGGQKTITINIRSFIENFNSQAITAKEGYAEIEQKLKESFTRIMASAAGMSPAGDY